MVCVQRQISRAVKKAIGSFTIISPPCIQEERSSDRRAFASWSRKLMKEQINSSPLYSSTDQSLLQQIPTKMLHRQKGRFLTVFIRVTSNYSWRKNVQKIQKAKASPRRAIPMSNSSGSLFGFIPVGSHQTLFLYTSSFVFVLLQRIISSRLASLSTLYILIILTPFIHPRAL